jgi:hypothetical protein
LDASTPSTESYKPAALIPARSSTLALERTAMNPADSNELAMDAHTSGGISMPFNATRIDSHAASRFA